MTDSLQHIWFDLTVRLVRSSSLSISNLINDVISKKIWRQNNKWVGNEEGVTLSQPVAFMKPTSRDFIF